MRRLARWALVALSLAAILTAGLCLRRWGVGLVRVSGTSMSETLRDGDLALVTRWDYLRRAPGRGDVVQCRFPGRADDYIKRVVGLPGERVAFEGGALTVDGRPLSEPYVSTPTEDYARKLGDGEYLLLGDNRVQSYDSRMDDMGTLGAGDFLGRVRFVLWPLSRLGPVT